MQPEQIETFLDLCQTRSFNRTAERLGVTQSTVSGRVAALEEALEVRLFDRSRAGTALTPEGRRFALGSGLTDAQRADPPPVGSWVTYRHRGVHPGSGLPRFASFLRVRADEARFRP